MTKKIDDPAMFWRFFRYIVVGVVTNLSGYSVYLLITYLGVGPKTGMTLLYLTVATLGFIGNRKITFQHKGDWRRSAGAYVVVHAGGYLINLMLLAVLTDIYGYPHQLVQLLAGVVVALYLFFAFNYVVFRKTDAP